SIAPPWRADRSRSTRRDPRAPSRLRSASRTRTFSPSPLPGSSPSLCASVFSAGPGGPGAPGGTGTLATVPIGGGAPRPIAEFIDRAAWTPDGKQLAIQRFLEGRNRIELPLGRVI